MQDYPGRPKREINFRSRWQFLQPKRQHFNGKSQKRLETIGCFRVSRLDARIDFSRYQLVTDLVKDVIRSPLFLCFYSSFSLGFMCELASFLGCNQNTIKLFMDFSIVTPTFNQPEWLQLCVASVLDQEEVNVEHIIQDGGEGKGLEWLKGEPRVRVCLEKDRGMYDAVTKGISKSSGLIIAHLNSDEQYLPGTLKLVKEFFDTHSDVEVLFGDAILIDAEGQPLSYRRITLPRRSHTIACHLGTSSSCTFFRRSVVDRGLSYTSEWRQIGDAALVLRWLDAGVKMSTIHRPLAVFTFTGVNMFTGSEAREERARLREKNSLGPLAIPSLLAVEHRLQKLLHGAYQTRDIEIEIFTQKSPGKRRKIRANKLGFRWPSTP